MAERGGGEDCSQTARGVAPSESDESKGLSGYPQITQMTQIPSADSALDL